MRDQCTSVRDGDLHSIPPSCVPIARACVCAFTAIASLRLRVFAASHLWSLAPSRLCTFAASHLRGFAPLELSTFAALHLRGFTPLRLRTFLASRLCGIAPLRLRTFATSHLCGFAPLRLRTFAACAPLRSYGLAHLCLCGFLRLCGFCVFAAFVPLRRCWLAASHLRDVAVLRLRNFAACRARPRAEPDQESSQTKSRA
jgi:hypothetical protein